MTADLPTHTTGATSTARKTAAASRSRAPVWLPRHDPEDFGRVSQRVFSISADGLAAPGAIAVLVRSNSEARLVRDCLAALKVPCVLETDESVFDTLEAAELLQVLAAVAQPARGGLVWGALITSLLGVSPRALEELRQNEETSEATLNVFSELNAVWQRRGFFQLIALLQQQPQQILCHAPQL